MKFRVDRDQFADAVAWAGRTVPTRPALPMLSGLRLEGIEGSEPRLSIASYDYEVSGRVEVVADVAEGGVALVNGRLLVDIAKALPAQPVDLGTEGTRLRVRCGRASFELPTLPVEEYPPLPPMPEPSGSVPGGVLAGAVATDEASGQQVQLQAPVVVLAMGGINGGHAEARRNWPRDRPMPARMLNGAHPFADGELHHHAADQLGARITHAGEMWNYAAGYPHPFPHFPGHGLSTIPCKSALWLDHRGQRIGPQPLVTGFDTHWLCQQVAAQEQPWTWHLLNWRIAAREFAISGAEHNPRIRDRQFPAFLKETLLGNHRLVRQMRDQSPHFLVDDSLAGLAAKMNALTASHDVRPEVLQATADAFDANFAHGTRLENDDQIRRILHARQWGPDKLRTCKPAPLQMKGAGPFIAIQMQLITRKSLGGLQTDLHSRVLDAAGAPVPGLYCVGEAAGFGGGGASGKRSLEGTFLPGCILTARAAARAIAGGG